MQSLILFGGIFVANILVNLIFSSLGFLRVVGDFFSTLVVFAAIMFWIVSIFRAWRGDFFKWPLVGKIASKVTGY